MWHLEKKRKSKYDSSQKSREFSHVVLAHVSNPSTYLGGQIGEKRVQGQPGLLIQPGLLTNTLTKRKEGRKRTERDSIRQRLQNEMSHS